MKSINDFTWALFQTVDHAFVEKMLFLEGTAARTKNVPDKLEACMCLFQT